MSIQKGHLKSKPKTFRIEKSLFFVVTLIQAVEAKMLRLLLIFLRKIKSLKNQLLYFTTSRDKKWGGGAG